MPFDQPTRNLLASFVSDARALLTDEFTRQLQQEYGLDPERGDVTDLSRLGHLDDARRATALLLRETLAYYLAAQPKPDAKARREALDRIVREQAFTILNRLCALRMAEGRGLLIESVGQGHRSRGFQLYGHLAGTGLGETGDAYRCYLFSLFDELALELPVLFDRYAPEGRLFPREVALSQVLALINAPEIAPLWAEDETIGWIYQYFNSVEERRQMRAESGAPRNSRELAVRNQFFTPRYVVEFLTDSTLGRIWYEMTQGQTSLIETCRYLVRRPTEIFLAEGEEAPQQDQSGEELSQEELVRQPVYIPHRPLKDPRDILMLDPACGSLHFGLYAFDLYERIYDEAWELEGVLGMAAFIRSEGLLPLRESYPDKAAFLADVPRLIIERNIHGIDIDPRAVQIAGLSLWLRAQRSWQAQGIKPQDRPQIRHSNIVCAEPMPGDRALLEEFLKTLRDERLEGLIRRVLKTPAHQRVRATPAMADALCDLVRTVWKEMELAGEAGSLLKIEDALEDAVARGRAEWDEKMPLFRVTEFELTEQAAEKPAVRYYKTIPGEGADFWDRAEALVLAALEDYAERAENGGGYRRRLFAGDAARGFAFIDICRKRFDSVLMNPPFGELSKGSKAYVESNYPSSRGNILAHFLERAANLTHAHSMVGAIVSRTCFYLTTMAEFRQAILGRRVHADVFADLGLGVLDAMVETAAVTFLRLSPQQRPSLFFRCLACEDKEDVLLSNVRHIAQGTVGTDTFLIAPLKFSLLAGSPYVYWIAPPLLAKIASHSNLEPTGCTLRVGLQTGDDQRFLRLWYEVPSGGIELRSPIQNNPASEGSPSRAVGAKAWAWYSKIDKASAFLAPLHLLVEWEDSGREIKAAHLQNGDSISRYVRSEDFYFRPGISYMPRSSRVVPYVVPRGVIPTAVRSQIYPHEGNETWLLALAASNVASAVARFRGETFWQPMFQNSMIAAVPYISEPSHVRERLRRRLAEAIREQHDYYSLDETSIYFRTLPKAFGFPAPPRLDRSTLLGRDLDDLIAGAFGFNSEDIPLLERDLMEGVNAQVAAKLVEGTEDASAEAREDVREDMQAEALVSYLIGCALGRWDVRCATSDKAFPPLSDPFDALTVCPPGMLQNDKGLPATPSDMSEDYPLRISWPGILADDAGHPEDIESRISETLRIIWPANADSVEAEACRILGVRTLREHFCKPGAFFADHLKRYSKSRRQAPIYWPLSTPSCSYTLWLYYHRLSDQTLYTCVNDFVDPKLKQVSDDAGRLRQKRGRSSAEEKALEQLAGLELELTDFRAELLRIAAFWKPNLNDGVQITAAPLWRLLQHRPWQRTLKETWESLERGEYDWAHLAMSIWPERVVPKCVTDRSLAIAHDVEDLFWVEDGGRWRNLNPPDEELAEQVRRQQRPGRDQLRSGLAALTLGEGRGLRCEQVYESLATGKWDDLAPALLLWPERVAKKCWDDPLLAVTLKIDLPTKRTKAARERFIAERVAAGCPDLADALREALAGRVDRFASLWAELARGDRDELALALALWPDRVVDKCGKDVGLAECHGLRRFLWCQQPNGIWRRRILPQQEVVDEVARRQRKGA